MKHNTARRTPPKGIDSKMKAWKGIAGSVSETRPNLDKKVVGSFSVEAWVGTT
jgi:hypothetical protein